MARVSVFTDDFNRSDSDTIGTGWSESFPLGGSGNGDLDISSNTLKVANAGTGNSSRAMGMCTTSMGSADNYTQAKVVGTSNQYIIARADAHTNPNYFYQANFRVGNNDIYVERYGASGDGYTSQANQQFSSITINDGDIISMEVETIDGSEVDVRVYVNGTLKGTYEDTNAARITSGNYCGVWGKILNMAWDDFECGYLGEATTSTTTTSTSSSTTTTSTSSSTTTTSTSSSTSSSTTTTSTSSSTSTTTTSTSTSTSTTTTSTSSSTSSSTTTTSTSTSSSTSTTTTSTSSSTSTTTTSTSTSLSTSTSTTVSVTTTIDPLSGGLAFGAYEVVEDYHNPSDASSATWADASNAITSNDSYASRTGEDGAITFTNFGDFDIPEGCTITNIIVELEGYRSGGSTIRNLIVGLSYNNGDSWAIGGDGSQETWTNVPLSDTTKELTIDNEHYDYTFVPADFQDGNLAIKVNLSVNASTTFYLDCVRVKVEYETAEEFVSWQTWVTDGEIIGDSDWGKLTLDLNELGYSQVYNYGNSSERTYTLTKNKYGTGQGSGDTLQIRGDTSSFTADDEVVEWENYTTPINREWQYVQVRIGIAEGGGEGGM